VAVLRQAGLGTCQGDETSLVSLRHTFGTPLNANGENPKVAQELLRHASLRVTTDVYMQAVGPQKREAQSNLVKLVRRGAVPEIKPALVDQTGS
jgi:integrase